MGDPAYVAPPQTNETTASRVQALTSNLPAFIQAMNQQVGPVAQAQLGAEQQIAPAEQALQAQLYQQFAPQYAQAQQQAQSGADLSSIQGQGGQAALAAQALQQQIDPEYYAVRSASANKLQDLINNPISGSEQSSIERANNQNALGGGRFGLNTNQQTVSNAMNFGAAGRDRLGQALSLATQSLPAYKSGTDTFAQATGRGGTNAIGQNNLTGQGQLGQQAYSSGQQLEGDINQNQMNASNITANRRDSLDRVQTALGQAASYS